jgi:Bardet-Biedl syndrome 2 protein
MSFGQIGSSLRTAFNSSFAHRLAQNAAASGSFNSDCHEQLVVGTETAKICFQGNESIFHVNEKIKFLSIYKPNSKIKKSNDSENSDYDIVIIGTNKSLMAFDVFNNKTIFHREISEGVHFIKVGKVDEHNKEAVIICGCGTTIWGFQLDGKDLFWTALGDQINVLELCDMDGDGLNELLVGTTGIEIKVLKKASFFTEFDEGDSTLAITAIKPATFAFGLSSGVVGVYGQGERLWRVKTKSRIVALLPFPDQGHVACVWQNAKVNKINIFQKY